MRVLRNLRVLARFGLQTVSKRRDNEVSTPIFTATLSGNPRWGGFLFTCFPLLLFLYRQKQPKKNNLPLSSEPCVPPSGVKKPSFLPAPLPVNTSSHTPKASGSPHLFFPPSILSPYFHHHHASPRLPQPLPKSLIRYPSSSQPPSNPPQKPPQPNQLKYPSHTTQSIPHTHSSRGGGGPRNISGE